MYQLTKNSEMTKFDKNGVNFVGFGSPNSVVGIVMESVEKGHFEEFVHDKSTFIYIFLEGEGVFFLDGTPVKVEAGDMLTVSPGTRIYYFGELKQLLITNPAFDPKYERHIRDVDEREYEEFLLTRGSSFTR